MKMGYARVSTEDQRMDLQLAALRQAGCREIFQDHGISGTIMKRPGLNKLLRSLQPGQSLVVWRLDRLGRSLSGLVSLIEDLGRRNVGFVSLSEAVDTTSSGGRLIFHIMAALAEFERTLISERTKAGMQAAHAQGKHMGRPRSLSEEDIVAAWRASQTENLEIVAKRYHVSTRTLQRMFDAVQL